VCTLVAFVGSFHSSSLFDVLHSSRECNGNLLLFLGKPRNIVRSNLGEVQNYNMVSRQLQYLSTYKTYGKLVYIRFVGNNLVYNFLREWLSGRVLVEDLVNLEVGGLATFRPSSLETQSWTRRIVGLP